MTFNKAFAAVAMLLVASTVVSASKPDSVAALVSSDPNFSILLAAVKAADPFFLNQLSRPNLKATVYAPTNAAFTALLKDLGLTAEQLLANTDLLNNVLRYHITPGARVWAGSLRNGQTVHTWLQGTTAGRFRVIKNGRNISFRSSSGRMARVIKTNVQAGATLVHVLGGVLVPRS